LPAPARDEVLALPAPAVNLQAEADEYASLLVRGWGELSPEEIARREYLSYVSGTGAFDDFLPETALRQELRGLLRYDNEMFGIMPDDWEFSRFQSLRNRFPDEVDAFNQQLHEGRSLFTALPETAPAARVPGADPYEPTVRGYPETFDPEDGWQPGFHENIPGLSPLAQPQTWRDQGIAGLYSRSARAGDRLQRREYSNVDELRRELEAFGAPPKELDALGLDNLAGFMFRAGPSGLESRGVTREEVQEFLRNAPGLSVTRTNKFADDYAPSGGRNYTSTTYHHPSARFGPMEAFEHFESVDQLPPLFHSRAAQYDLQFPDGGTTHHVVEIQSDWGQHRTTLPNKARDENSMEVLQLRNKPTGSRRKFRAL